MDKAKAIEKFFQSSKRFTLRQTAKILYLAMITIQVDGIIKNMTMDSLALVIGASMHGVFYSTKELSASGLIEIEPGLPKVDSGRPVNVYHVLGAS